TITAIPNWRDYRTNEAVNRSTRLARGSLARLTLRGSRLRGSRWQLRPGLLADHILGIPAGPVHVALPGPLLVLAMRGLRTAECAREVGHRGERDVVGVHTSGQSCGDLLEQPAIAVGIAERGEGAVAGVVWRGTAHATARAVGLELSTRRA